MRMLRASVACGLVALALVGQTAAGPRAGAVSNQEILVKYSGRLDSSWEPIMRQPDGRNFNVARYQWTLTWRGRINQLAANPNQYLKADTLKGTVKYVDNTSAEHADCDGGFKAKVKKIPVTVSVNSSASRITFNPRFPVSDEFLVATNKTSPHEFCSQVVWWGLPDQLRVPFFTLKLKGKGDAKSVNRSYGPANPNREKAVIRSTFSVTIEPRR